MALNCQTYFTFFVTAANFGLNQYNAIYIPKPLENACFRTLERFMIKAAHFIKGYSLKKGGNEEHGLPKRPRRAGLETLYAALLILVMEQPFSSINALSKGFSNSS
jgi:hypothetical protein